jgi:diketogulonate reductase-like aldo/keto reductase
MACSPIEQGQLLARPALQSVAQRHGATPAQVALAWVIGHEGVMTIPRAASPEHVQENRGALDLELTREDLVELDNAFAPPTRPRQLELR